MQGNLPPNYKTDNILSSRFCLLSFFNNFKFPKIIFLTIVDFDFNIFLPSSTLPFVFLFSY